MVFISWGFPCLLFPGLCHFRVPPLMAGRIFLGPSTVSGLSHSVMAQRMAGMWKVSVSCQSLGLASLFCGREEVRDSWLAGVEEPSSMILGSPHDEVDVFSQARRCPAAGLVHCVVDEVLLVCSQPVHRVSPPLCELIKELATLIFVSQGRLSVEDSVPVVPDGTKEHLPQATWRWARRFSG